MSHHVISTVFVALALHSVAAGQDARLVTGSVQVLPVAQQVDQDSGQLAGESIYGSERYARKDQGRFVLPSLDSPTTAIAEIGSGVVPPGMEAEGPVVTRPIPEGPDREGFWELSLYPWRAPNTFSNPRYFEDVMLERHGHERFPVLQPMVSGFRFFATVPVLPYLMTVRPPCDVEYTLGYYRPGSRAPALIQRPPYERKAILVEAASVLPFAL